MADYANITLARDGAVARLTLNRPDRRNALTHAMMLELEDAFGRIRDDQSCRVLVLRGAGGHFCAGGDLDAMADMPPPAGQRCDRSAGGGLSPVRRRAAGAQHACRRPTVAIVEGSAVGGGFGMACCSDVVILHESARFGMPEPKVGFIPSQIIPFVVRRVGEGPARDLAVTGRVIDAAEAQPARHRQPSLRRHGRHQPDAEGGARRHPAARAAGGGDGEASGAVLRHGG